MAMTRQDDISRMTKNELEREVRRLRNLVPSHVGSLVVMTPFELAHVKRAFAEGALARQQARVRVEVELTAAITDLQLLMLQIDATAWYPMPYLAEVISEGLDETLSSALTRLIRVAQKPGAPLIDVNDMSEFTKQVSLRITGVQKVLNGEDKGEYLRSVVSPMGGIHERLKALRERLTKDSGAPKGMSPWRCLLAERILELERIYPGEKRPQIANRLITEWRASANLGDDEQLALGQLETWARKGREKLRENVTKALRDYRKEANRDK